MDKSITGKEEKLHYRSVFRRVMAIYQGYKGSLGNTVESRGGDKTGEGMVYVTPSDYICDVETAARRSLNKGEYLLFKNLYMDFNPDIIAKLQEKLGEEAYSRFKNRVQINAGKGFKKRGVFPVSDYLSPVDTR